MRKLNLLAAASLLALGACTTAQQTTAATAVNDIQAACSVALTTANATAAIVKGGAANTVAGIDQYLVSGCATLDAVKALAANSTSLAWLNQQTGALQAIAATAPVTP